MKIAISKNQDYYTFHYEKRVIQQLAGRDAPSSNKQKYISNTFWDPLANTNAKPLPQTKELHSLWSKIDIMKYMLKVYILGLQTKPFVQLQFHLPSTSYWIPQLYHVLQDPGSDHK